MQGQENDPVGYQVGRSFVPRSCCSVTGWDSVTLATTSRSVSSPLMYVTLAVMSALPYTPGDVTLYSP